MIPEKIQVGLVHRCAAGPLPRCDRVVGGISIAARRGTSLIGRSVVDAEGVEMGYVAAEDEKFLLIGEGTTGKLRLGRRFVDRITDRVVLRGNAVDLFTGLNVVDVQGEFVGVVRDTMESEDVLDSLIVEDEQGEMVTVLLEDVRSIDEWIELGVTADAMYEA